MELLYLALFLSSLILLNQARPLQQSDIAEGAGLAPTQAPSLLENGDEEELVGEPDFEDEGVDSLLDLVDSKEGNVDSLMLVHQRGGEILVPCFGMWWPMGGGGSAPPVYEYEGDYYGDYKKKRRSRKRKRAKAKRKKS